MLLTMVLLCFDCDLTPPAAPSFRRAAWQSVSVRRAVGTPGPGLAWLGRPREAKGSLGRGAWGMEPGARDHGYGTRQNLAELGYGKLDMEHGYGTRMHNLGACLFELLRSYVKSLIPKHGCGI